MKIIWDERKRLGNLTKHGLDFAALDLFDWEKARFVAARDSRFEQPRLKATGQLAGKVVTVVFALRGKEAMSIISLRAASIKERREFEWSRSTRH